MKFFPSKKQKDKHLDEAAALFMRVHDNDTSSEDWQAYQAWKAKSGYHKKTIENMESFWNGMDKMNGLSWPSPDECEQDGYDGKQPLPVNKDSIQDPRITSLFHTFFRPVPVVISVLTGLALVIWQLTSTSLTPGSNIYHTEVAEHKLITLEDGSELLLGGKSSVKINYNNSHRQVFLDMGEVLFTVAKDADRPFIVKTEETDVIAVGTQFNIRKIPDEIIISVTEGVVHVSTPLDKGQPKTSASPGFSVASETPNIHAELKVGQQIRYNRHSGASPVVEMKSEEIVSWRDGRLIYTGEPLWAVIADINRYYHQKIQITNPEVEELLFSGTVRKDSIKEWLEGLEAVFPINLYESGRTLYLTKRLMASFDE